MRLEGKVAIVTGAGCVGPGWGNGRATAVLFAREGAQVFAVDRDGESMTETLARRRVRRHDRAARMRRHRQRPPVEAMVDGLPRALRPHRHPGQQRRRLGRGRSGGDGRGRLGRARSTYNLKSVFLACKHVLPVMERQGGGAIVNLASTSGLRWTGSPQVGYAASKAGVIQLSRVVAVQYAKQGHPREHRGARASCTRRWSRRGSPGSAPAATSRRCSAAASARIPLGFMGDGRDTANAALFLASDEARFVTGTEIVVDGGMTARCD